MYRMKQKSLIFPSLSVLKKRGLEICHVFMDSIDFKQQMRGGSKNKSISVDVITVWSLMLIKVTFLALMPVLQRKSPCKSLFKQILPQEKKLKTCQERPYLLKDRFIKVFYKTTTSPRRPVVPRVVILCKFDGRIIALISNLIWKEFMEILNVLPSSIRNKRKTVIEDVSNIIRIRN